LRKKEIQAHIDFVPQTDTQKRDHYLSYLKPDLSFLGLSLMGSHMEQSHQGLQTALELITRKVGSETTKRVTGDNV
jgi:hypothetical protein